MLAQCAKLSTWQQKVKEQEAVMIQLQSQLESEKALSSRLQVEVTEKDKKIQKLEEKIENYRKFSVRDIMKQQKQSNGLFKYYTGITYVRFLALLTFLAPNEITYRKHRKDIKRMP